MAQINVNGKTVVAAADEALPLLWVLRGHLGLTDTKYGCGIAQCRTCTVHQQIEAQVDGSFAYGFS